MNIIAVDDERMALDNLMDAIREAAPEAELMGFLTGSDAIDYVEIREIDIAFLDIEMRDINGMELARWLKVKFPKINIIFTTGYSHYAGEAMALHASGYITKPVTAKKIKEELEDLRNPLGDLPPRGTKKMRARTFGEFELYVNGRPVHFKYNKTLELVAYLIHQQGEMCSTQDILELLWPGEDPDEHQSYLKNLRSDLKSVFAVYDCSKLLDIRWGKMSLLTSEIDCDLYDFINGDAAAINAYQGEYMKQYAWAKFEDKVKCTV